MAHCKRKREERKQKKLKQALKLVYNNKMKLVHQQAGLYTQKIETNNNKTVDTK